MKKSRKIFLGTLMACSLVGIGTATAFLVTGAHTDITGQADEAIILNWDEQNTVTADIQTLTPSNPAFLHVGVKAPQKTTGATGDAKVTFALSVGECADADNENIVGLKIEIADTDWGVEAPTPIETISTVDNTTNAGVSYTTDAITEDDIFYLRVSIDADNYAEYYAPETRAETYTLCGVLTISYDVE